MFIVTEYAALRGTFNTMNTVKAWNKYVVPTKTKYSKDKTILGHHTNDFELKKNIVKNKLFQLYVKFYDFLAAVLKICK